MTDNNGRPMNGAEIAKKLGISRQAVSYSIRTSMKKMYKYVLTSGLADSPFQAAVVLMESLKVNKGSISDIKEFVSLFDKETRKKITDDAASQFNIS